VKPFQRILVPVDFSEPSSRTLQVAADLSRRYEAAVTLVHVYESPVIRVPEVSMFISQAQVDELLAKLRTTLATAQREAEAAGALQVSTQLLEGSAASEIRDFAQQGAFDLIVMGTHGRTGVDHLLMGSVAERVVRTAPCPVLTIRMPSPAKAG